MLYFVSWILFQLIKPFFRVEGRNNIPKSGGLIVVSNHINNLDPYFMGPFFPFSQPIHWLAKKELYSTKEARKDFGVFASLVVFCVKHSLTIPIDREKSLSEMNRVAIVKAVHLLKQGKVLGFFAEGGIGREGEVHRLAVSLAVKTGAQILPVKLAKGKIIFGESRRYGHNCKRQEIEVYAVNLLKTIYEL